MPESDEQLHVVSHLFYKAFNNSTLLSYVLINKNILRDELCLNVIFNPDHWNIVVLRRSALSL